MKVVIDSMLRLQEVPEEVLEQIKAELTIKNPDYVKKKAIGLNRYAWGPEYIKLWNEMDINGQKEYILPRGYYARLYELTSGQFQQICKRVHFNRLQYPKKPVLRDYQYPVLDAAQAWWQGVVIAPCGSGKTEMAMGIVEDLGQPTLWITHTMDLLKQSMDRAVNRLGLKGNQIGVIQGENMSIGTHMTFATVQTLAKRDLSEIKDKFGCVIVDECHLVFKDAAKARMFESVISQMPALYRFGLTASEYRSDGLIETMFHIIGPKIYEVAQDDPRLSVVKPRVEFVETEFDYTPEGDMLNVQQMIKAMREDPIRDRIILKLLIPEKEPVCTLVLGDSLEHLDSLCERLADYLGSKYSYAFIHGNTKKSEREKTLKDMRNGKINYLFATYQLAKLGLDIPRLNKLVLATPKRDKTSIQQAVGRIMRPFEGKLQPVVYDIWDSKVPQLRYWARERVKVYKSLGAEIIGGPKVRK